MSNQDIRIGLVAQKNAMLERVITSETPDQLHGVLHQLYDVVTLWGALGYNAEGDEMCERIEQCAQRFYSHANNAEWLMVRDRARVVAECHRDEQYMRALME